MAQFDVYPNPNIPQRAVFPFVVQMQNDFFDAFPTRWVLPLQRARIPIGSFPRRLTTPVVIDGESLFMAAHLSAPLLAKTLKRAVANVADQRSVLQDAIDALQSGV
jgi:toxin CcdB